MPPVEERKGLLVTFRGMLQQKVVSILRSYPRLPCYGGLARSRCVCCFLPYFPQGVQKVPTGCLRIEPTAGLGWRRGGGLLGHGHWTCAGAGACRRVPAGRRVRPSGFWLGAEHSRGDAGYKTAGDES